MTYLGGIWRKSTTTNTLRWRLLDGITYWPATDVTASTSIFCFSRRRQGAASRTERAKPPSKNGSLWFKVLGRCCAGTGVHRNVPRGCRID